MSNGFSLPHIKKDILNRLKPCIFIWVFQCPEYSTVILLNKRRNLLLQASVLWACHVGFSLGHLTIVGLCHHVLPLLVPRADRCRGWAWGWEGVLPLGSKGREDLRQHFVRSPLLSNVTHYSFQCSGSYIHWFYAKHYMLFRLDGPFCHYILCEIQ